MTSAATRAGPVDVAGHLLDNAAWHSLVGAHAGVARGSGLARRYRSDISVFHAAESDDEEAWADLARVATRDGTVVIFRGAPVTPPAGWRCLHSGQGFQMVLASELSEVDELAPVDEATGRPVTLRSLDDADIDQMLALVELTEPGPFQRRTLDLGGYIGIFHAGELVAMAGQRLRPPGYCEVSAVCTRPDARRRGCASIVSAQVATAISARGETPFLHVATDNAAARQVYERLGFEVRRTVSFGVYRVPDTSDRAVPAIEQSRR